MAAVIAGRATGFTTAVATASKQEGLSGLSCLVSTLPSVSASTAESLTEATATLLSLCRPSVKTPSGAVIPAPVRPWQPGASTPTARAVMSGHLLSHSVGPLVVMEELVMELMEELVVEGNRGGGWVMEEMEGMVLDEVEEVEKLLVVVVIEGMLGVLVAVDVMVVEMEVLVEEEVAELIEMVEEDVIVLTDH
ncbi:unnamed protein product [Gadus morhua 'NCC']